MTQPIVPNIVTPVVTSLVSFDIAYKQLMSWEDPHMTGVITSDAGGLTRYGISQNSHPSLDIRTLTAVRAKEITEKDYWLYTAWDISRLPYNEINQRLVNKLLQMGFNIGVGTVIQLSNLFLTIINVSNIMPKLGDPLIIENISVDEADELLLMLAAAQISRYAKDYHFVSKIPHSLMDRGLEVG